MDESLDSIAKEILKCPVCLDEISITPVYQCYNGHLICKGCRARDDIKDCPICQVTLGNLRNNVVEKLVNIINPLIFYCPGIDCNEKVREKNLDDHIEEKKHKFIIKQLKNDSCAESTYR